MHDFDNLQAGAEFVYYDVTTGEGTIGVYLNFESFGEGSVGGTSLEEEDASV